MKVLIIDRDTMFSNLMASKIKALGHEVIEKHVKNDGLETLDSKQIDVVYFDPSPMIDPRPILLQIRRMVNSYPYLVRMTENTQLPDLMQGGCHDVLSKPLDSQALERSLKNAERMCDLVRRIGNESYDFPSAGGVISKSAFNQLFRSAIDRVNRYKELSHALFIRIANYDDIAVDDGRYAAEYASSKLAQNLATLRRQSDILAQTGKNEYAILLQRPQTERESPDAAKRFASAMEDLEDITEGGARNVFIEVHLVHLPSGNLEFERTIRLKGSDIRHLQG